MLEISWAELLTASWVWLRNNVKGELGSVGFTSLIFLAQSGTFCTRMVQLYSLEEE